MTDKVDCPKYEDCSAPICPLQRYTIDRGIWYPDEDICTAKRFQTLAWVRTQRAITRAGAADDRYFTAPMLNSVRQVRKGIEGIDPDQPLKQAEEAEQRWITDKKGRRVVATPNPKPGRVTRAGKHRSTPAATVPHQPASRSIDHITTSKPKTGKLRVIKISERRPSMPRKVPDELLVSARIKD